MARQDNPGRPRGLLRLLRIAGFILDQTQKKQSEKALRRGQKMEAVGQLTGGIAHDFNNILGIILGNLELLEAQLRNNNAAKERIDSLLAVTNRAVNLTQQLLGFARSEPGLSVVSNLDHLIDSMRALIERSITLPRARPQSVTDSIAAATNHAANTGTETILVVDDESGLLKLAQQRLSRLGYRVLTASDGEQGLQVLEQNPDVALLFTDVVMPGALNGYAMAANALTQRPHLKVLHTSGYADETLARTYAGRFTNPLLKKPHSMQELA